MRRFLLFLIVFLGCAFSALAGINSFYADGESGKSRTYPFSNFKRIDLDKTNGVKMDVRLKDNSTTLQDNRIVVFSEAAAVCTVKFINYDGSLLQESEVSTGTIPVYTGTEPEHKPDRRYTYTFSGWTPALAPVTGDAVYTATYSVKAAEYAIVVKVDTDGGGTTTGSGTYEYGEKVIIKATPDDGYAFEHWENGESDAERIVVVKGDATYTATFHTQNADNTKACANVASVAKYDWLLMLHVNDLKEKGYTFDENNVVWYRVVGKQDNLSDPEIERDDQIVGTGYYYTIDKTLNGTGLYYGIVNLPKQSADLGCQGVMRTVTYNYKGQASASPSLLPTIVAPGGNVDVIDLPVDDDVEILVYDQIGKLYYEFHTYGTSTYNFISPYNHGNYIVIVKTKDGDHTLRYIVK